MGHFVAQRRNSTRTSWAYMSPVATGSLIKHSSLDGGMYARHPGWRPQARGRWFSRGRLRLQAYSLSLGDGFLLISWSCVCALILVGSAAPTTLDLWRP